VFSTFLSDRSKNKIEMLFVSFKSCSFNSLAWYMPEFLLIFPILHLHHVAFLCWHLGVQNSKASKMFDTQPLGTVICSYYIDYNVILKFWGCPYQLWLPPLCPYWGERSHGRFPINGHEYEFRFVVFLFVYHNFLIMFSLNCGPLLSE